MSPKKENVNGFKLSTNYKAPHPCPINTNNNKINNKTKINDGEFSKFRKVRGAPRRHDEYSNLTEFYFYAFP